MAMLTMPVIVANLGCEMLYILDQRLRAHEVPSTKGAQVLDDIASFMFDENFINTIFNAHEMYSVRSTHLVFSRLAHSSIMRLSTSSMEKLFDLILMGVKMQLLVSITADALLEITRRHIENARKLIAGTSGPLIDAFLARLNAAFDALTPGQWLTWRAKMSSFFLDRRIKVSLFLQEGIQAKDGHFYLPPPTASASAQKVGTVLKLSANGSVAHSKVVHLACQDEDPNEFFCHPTPLGDNLYCPDRPKVLPPPRRAVHVRLRNALINAPSLGDALIPAATARPSTIIHALSDFETMQPDAGCKLEHDLLRHMFGTAQKAAPEFKLALFEDDDSDDAGRPTGGDFVLDVSAKVKLLRLGEEGNREYIGALRAGLEGVGDSGEAEEEDLLKMMDEAVGA